MKKVRNQARHFYCSTHPRVDPFCACPADTLPRKAAQDSKNAVGKEKLADTIIAFQEGSATFGVTGGQLDRLLDIVGVNSRLDQGTAGKIIRFLHPREKIGKSSLLRVVGSLGLGNVKPALPTQVC